ncbi:PotD/PotF family extracellular solute-binding protein [Streptomyces microflavus]|uniref:Spermidine/putrescine ABC transporter substrate-binding protein n=2 Tax=Streptomyces microflavus subgroup TaxID=1482601 RepID=A0A6N9V6M1_STRMI|nr:MULTISPECIES: spermidine/putrescine ABC transporter substrate-binding protein [Streptomyces]MBK5993488.1 spermidine/putrescine ABC transporter substrate-binding protein [Streptomyces sp. MBT58]MBW3361553.1 spermidine/putrescine ABC transporter substrate-binding protein [Streptomyces sp. 09ZI22]MEE1728922.1 spermidine/putrescine ABC transporter substrate-binding protein [Streptomyces sp. BE282]NEB66858.1 spermidine/putrescine ABC transporter substrate-binding protein [Streptomyces microflavus
MESYEPERLSPVQLAAMRRSLTNGRGALTRRSLLRASGMGALALGGIATLGACGIPPAGRAEGAAAADDHSAKEKEVTFSNWTEYMDVSDDEKSRPTLEAFTKRTGIRVKYTEDINDNVEFFGKIKPQLAAGQNTGRDLICVTDWLAARIIRLGWAQKLDPSNLPHAFANVSAQFRTPDWDPGRAYSYPWTGIPTVIAYNAKATGGRKVDSVTQLLDDPKLKGRVSFLSEMRDTVGMTLLDQGKDPGKFTDTDFDGAIGRLQKAVDKKQIRRFTGNDYTADLSKGDIAACVGWAGDIIQLQADNPDIKFAIPAAGYITSSDNLLVPAQARHKTNAEKLIDYYYEPPVAAQLAAYINYVCPVDGVRDELAKIDESMASNTLILPDREMAAKSRSFRSLSTEEETAYEEKFAKLIGA